MKKIKDGSLYFHQKNILLPIGTGLLLAGIVIAYFTLSWILYILAGFMAAAGLVLFILAGSRNISDNDIKEQIEHAVIDYERVLTDMDNFDRIVLKQPEPVECSAFHFGHEVRYFKKGKNGTPLSDIYTVSKFFFSKDALMVVSRSVCISAMDGTEGSGVTDYSDIFSFDRITSAAVEEHTTTVTYTNNKKTATVKWCELVLVSHEGELLRLPVSDSMDISALCDYVNRRIERKMA